jgi:hypothetical protein
MRGLTKDAFVRMDLQSQSWEYASEIVLKSVHMKLRTTEVGVRFLKDREGRVSHHKRLGWFSPWSAAWANLRAMFVYGADFFALKPGFVLFALGLLLTLPLTFGAYSLGAVTFSLHWSLAGVTLAVLGLQSIYTGCLARTFYDASGRERERLLRTFSYNRTVLVSVVLFVTGFVLASFLVVEYVREDFTLGAINDTSYRAVTGVMLMILAFMTFTFMLLLHASNIGWSARRDR